MTPTYPSLDALRARASIKWRFYPEEVIPCWIADMGAPQALATTAHQPAVVMIGPEGGFVPFEVQLAEAAGAQRVHLGERILSVDTALITVLAQALPGLG